MYVTITSLELKSIWHFFSLANQSRKILGQLKSQPVLKVKTRGLGRTHYTITSWKEATDLKEFARNGHHLKAMQQSAKWARVIVTYTYETETFPSWKTAKELLHEKGKRIEF